MASVPPECLVMAKPAGPACNLRCAYCYYIGKEDEFPAGPRHMPADLLQNYIQQRLEASPGPQTHFEWHGGEPTLLGLDYFRLIVRLQRLACPPGRGITNGLQTNGWLLDKSWASFLKREKFSVGLSLDGPAECHDAYRRAPGGQTSHAQAVRAFHLLKQTGVFCNVLCVLQKKNTAEPDKVYDFFRGLGAQYLQFLPFVPRRGEHAAEAAAAAPEDIGTFLCRVFDLWIQADVGRIVIQAFDEALRPVYGVPHALCIHRETCGDVAVLEHDGSFFACDHFVDSEHLLGNLRERSLLEMAADPRLVRFGQDKRDTLPRACRECEVLAFCHGGCPKDRLAAAPGEAGGLNYLCPAYKKFFRHCQPGLARLADHLKGGRPLRALKA